jgi:hypothetical protein
MNKTDTYRETLHTLTAWEPFLLAESGLPGPRGNLELAQVVADEGDEAMFAHWRTFDAQQAPANSPYEFLAFCGPAAGGRSPGCAPDAACVRFRFTLAHPQGRSDGAPALGARRYGRAAGGNGTVGHGQSV